MICVGSAHYRKSTYNISISFHFCRLLICLPLIIWIYETNNYYQKNIHIYILHLIYYWFDFPFSWLRDTEKWYMMVMNSQVAYNGLPIAIKAKQLLVSLVWCRGNDWFDKATHAESRRSSERYGMRERENEKETLSDVLWWWIFYFFDDDQILYSMFSIGQKQKHDSIIKGMPRWDFNELQMNNCLCFFYFSFCLRHLFFFLKVYNCAISSRLACTICASPH